MSNTKTKQNIQRISVTAMLVALAFVGVLLGRLVPNVAGFLSYDPKDVIVVIGGFIYGPVTALVVSVLCSLIEMFTISTTGLYGLLMNIVSTCAFALPAAFIYKKVRKMRGAVIGLIVGVFVMTIMMMLWNYIITPFYMGVDRSVVAGMMMSVFAPFNFFKGGINMGLTLLLYKPVITALRKTHLVEESAGGSKFQIKFLLIGLPVLVTFVLLFLVLLGIL